MWLESVSTAGLKERMCREDNREVLDDAYDARCGPLI